MIPPGSPLGVEIGFDKARNELFEWVILRDITRLDVVMIERDGHVARIAHNVDNARVLGLKAFVTFQDARPFKPSHRMVRIKVNLWQARFDVRKRDWIVRVDEITDQKSSPGVAGARIRNDENIIRKNGYVSSCHLTPDQDPSRLRECSQNSLCIALEIVNRLGHVRLWLLRPSLEGGGFH